MYCTISEAAQMLGVSRPTVYAMILRGELKKHKMLGRPALKVAEVKRKNGQPRNGKHSSSET